MENIGAMLKIASSCLHTSGERHRFVLMDHFGLLMDLDRDPVAYNGVGVGRFGIVVRGSVDIHAVLRNVLWEDEHCHLCCGRMIRYTSIDQRFMFRCGPTIGGQRDVVSSLSTADARRITDEYWSD